jgi:UDP-N-acetylmuramyl pentapeptide phosphotransferase/UDP-N-acetylglucosamine-1-phosphate transferase
LLTSLIFGFYFYFSGEPLYAVLALSLAGSLVAFLIYNFYPAKIFMGDTGSLLIGLVNSILVIKFITIASSPSSRIPLESAPALGFAILLVPLFDTLRVVSHRIMNRRSPFCPDRNHIHHFLLDLGLSHKMIACTCVATNILFIALAYSLRFAGSSILMLILCSVAIFIVGFVYYNKPKRNLLVSNGHLHEETIIKTHKILTLSEDAVEQNLAFSILFFCRYVFINLCTLKLPRKAFIKKFIK